MSDRENDPQNQAIDPPENTREGSMSMVPPEEPRDEASDPPENTKQPSE
jgi:hypothetical protein